MESVFKIVKINFIAVIALLVYLASIAAKLIARTLENLIVLLGAAIFILVFTPFASIIKTCLQSSEYFFYVCLVIFLMFFTIVGLFALLILTVFSGIVRFVLTIITSVTKFLVGCMEAIAEFLLDAYKKLYDICDTDCDKLFSSNKGLKNQCLCLLWTLLKLFSFITSKLLSFAGPLSIVGSVAVVIGAIALVQSNISDRFGISIITYLGLFPIIEIILPIIYFIIMVGVLVFLVSSYGYGWEDWEKLDVTY
ncbi:MAG: hypothetical protein GX383_08650 [Clostridium sp.]|nr:hypothetical protein [Clostridium sp.]